MPESGRYYTLAGIVTEIVEDTPNKLIFKIKEDRYLEELQCMLTQSKLKHKNKIVVGSKVILSIKPILETAVNTITVNGVWKK